MDRGPSEVLRDIERINDELVKLGDKYASERRSLAEKQLNYEHAVMVQQVRIYDEGKREGKIPAEDMRKAMAHMAIESDIWKSYLIGTAEVDSVKKLIDTRQSVLSGLQSELQQLRVEFTHA